MNAGDSGPGSFYPGLARYLVARIAEFPQIPPGRQRDLRDLAGLIDRQRQASGEARITFICTHNSRRSHLAQIWAEIAAAYHDIAGVATYSGGTEATVFDRRAVAALRRAGLGIEPQTGGGNPRYEIRVGSRTLARPAFSKVYDQDPNPRTGFLAVMTCSQADNACPIVAGSAGRIAITYEDPKAFDGTEQETAMYDERCRQICREMLYVFAQFAGS